MQLDGKQQRELEQLLLGAFPRRADLARMVRYDLDESLDKLAMSGPLNDTVFQLVEWARTRDKITNLLTAALENNPDHPGLKSFAAQIGRPQPAAPGVIPPSVQITWQERRDLYNLLISTLTTVSALHRICILLSVSYSTLHGLDLQSKIEDLMLEMEHRARIEDLVAAVRAEAKRQNEDKVRDTKRAWAHNKRGLNYYEQERYDEAIVEFTHAIQLKPGFASAHFHRGLTYAAQRRYEEARSDYTRAIALNRTFAIDYFHRGLTYYEEKRYDEARTDFIRATELDPKYVRAYYYRGLTFSAQQRWVEARTAYTRAVEIDPLCARAYFHRGITYYAQHRYREAEDDCTRAIQLDPDFAMAYSNRALSYYAQQRYDEAYADYMRAIRRDSNLAIARVIPPAATASIAQHPLGIQLKGTVKRLMPTGQLEIALSGISIPLPEQEQVLIGIPDPSADTPIAPDIDLKPFGAHEAGVSRKHARILRRGSDYLIEDLQSVNFTRLNGHKLEPNRPALLSDGAQIEFGKLAVWFRLAAS